METTSAENHRPRRTHRPWALAAAAGLATLLLAGPRLVAVGNEPPTALAQAAKTRQAAPVDHEEREAEHQMARRIMQDNCLICHSQEMIASQRLTAAQWKAEVEKMVGWGSPLPPEQAAPLAAYLGEMYTDAGPAKAPARIALRDALRNVLEPPATHPATGRGNLQHGAALYQANCASCHGPDGQGADLGPNVVGIVRALDPADFHEVVAKGKHRMPAFQTLIKGQDEEDVRLWLLQKRYTPKLPAK